jgi:hypothetical protein
MAMPAVEGGSLVLEVSEVLNRVRDVNWLDAIVDLAVENNAVLVTSPSLAVVEGPRGPLITALGVGTLIIEKPTSARDIPENLRLLRLKRREWVDGCRVEFRGEAAIPEGPQVSLEGTAVAFDYRDPAALLVNGLQARYSLVDAILDTERVLAEVEGRPLLGILADRDSHAVKYVVHTRAGEAARRLRYIAPLAGGCKGGLR